MTLIDNIEILKLKPTERAFLEAAVIVKQLGNFLDDPRRREPFTRSFSFLLGNAATIDVDETYSALLRQIAADDPLAFSSRPQLEDRIAVDPDTVSLEPRPGEATYTDVLTLSDKEGVIIRSVTPLEAGLVHVQLTAHRLLLKRPSVGTAALQDVQFQPAKADAISG